MSVSNNGSCTLNNTENHLVHKELHGKPTGEGGRKRNDAGIRSLGGDEILLSSNCHKRWWLLLQCWTGLEGDLLKSIQASDTSCWLVRSILVNPVVRCLYPVISPRRKPNETPPDLLQSLAIDAGFQCKTQLHHQCRTSAPKEVSEAEVNKGGEKGWRLPVEFFSELCNSRGWFGLFHIHNINVTLTSTHAKPAKETNKQTKKGLKTSRFHKFLNTIQKTIHLRLFNPSCVRHLCKTQ